MGPSSRHEGGTMDMGGTGLRDDGSTGALAHEDADMNSAPLDASGHQNIPSGLIDDGSHNPSLNGEGYKGRYKNVHAKYYVPRPHAAGLVLIFLTFICSIAWFMRPSLHPTVCCRFATIQSGRTRSWTWKKFRIQWRHRHCRQGPPQSSWQS